MTELALRSISSVYLFVFGGWQGSIGRALASGGVSSPHLASSIPDRYPWVYCVGLWVYRSH